MSEHSETRKELEASIRAVLPTQEELSSVSLHQPPTVAVAGIGVGGLLTGYFWVRLRGRRLHKKTRR